MSQNQAVGFIAVASGQIGDVRGKGAPLCQPGGQFRGGRHAAAVEAEAAGQRLQRSAMALNGQTAMQAQRLGRHLAGDVGIAVTVAADPRAQTQPGVPDGQAGIVTFQSGIQVGVDTG